MKPATETVAPFIAGFVAAEGTFSHSGRRFYFAVTLGAVDESVCCHLREYFGVGGLYTSQRRKPHNDDEICFRVGSMRELVEVIVPFMDEHLPESYKRQQYHQWRARLMEYWANKARRPRPLLR